MDKQDKLYQRKMALQELMGGAGMKSFKEDLADDMAYINANLDWKGCINETGLCKLNYDLGMKAGLEMVLNRLASYQDELVGDDVKPPKK